ncbi:MAG: Asp-tRNA(Asn)/Glu-tRNA(Gln) amidotransferase subunit GatB [Myxococcota bacterium]
MQNGWETVIGLEVHAQLRTKAKLFSSAPNGFGGAPNSRTTEVDVGMPGVLPVINERAVELAVRAALALGCEIQPVSLFARKHYFYPDLPKGYQISQYESPFAIGGGVPIELDGESRSIPLTRVHMEEDAGKSIHDAAVTGGEVTFVDLNRAGVPLIEIVSEPEVRSPEEAGAYLRSLRSILRYLGVSDADMEKGNFRCDANISVRRTGQAELGTRVELKNLNSFKFVEKGLAHEIERQIDVLQEGGEVLQETRNWNESAGESRPQRGKEEADDYRYFPDPDLPPLRLEEEWVEAQRRALPELPHQKRARYTAEFGLPAGDTRVLTEEPDVAGFFESAVEAGGDPKTVANWVMRNLLAVRADSGCPLGELPITPQHLVELLDLLDSGRITATSAREIFFEMARSGERPEAIMRSEGLEAVSDVGELEDIAKQVIRDHADQVEAYRAGQEKLFNFFVGQIMQATRGKASPDAVRAILTQLLAS